MAENAFLATGEADAGDHGIVVERVGKNQAARHELGDGRDTGLVGDIARGKNESGFLPVQVRQLALQFDEGMICSGNVPGAARAGAHANGSFKHGYNNFWVLPHAEIVVRSPDHAARPANASERWETAPLCAPDRRTPDIGAQPRALQWRS